MCLSMNIDLLVQWEMAIDYINIFFWLVFLFVFRSPTYDVAAILTSIQSLLHDPNPNSPANAEAAQLFQENRKDYNKRVRQTVEESWL